MKLFTSSDAHWESGLGQVLDELTGYKFRQHFDERDYGSGLTGLSVIFMCRDPVYYFKRRIKFSKKEKPPLGHHARFANNESGFAFRKKTGRCATSV